MKRGFLRPSSYVCSRRHSVFFRLLPSKWGCRAHCPAPPAPPAAPSASRKRVRSCCAPRACPAALHALALIHTPADIPAAPARHRHGDARGEPPPRPPDGHARRGQPGERGSLQAELPGPLLLFCLLQPMVSLSCRPRVSCLDRIVSFYKLSRRDPDAHVTVLREQVSKERIRVKHGRGRGPNAPEPTSLPEEGDVPVPLPTCGGGAAT